MKLKKIILILFFTLLSCSLDSTLYLTGNEDAVEAKVYIDKKYIGKMEKVKEGAQLIVDISAGEHSLLVISGQRKEFKKRISIQGEDYISVEFEKSE